MNADPEQAVPMLEKVLQSNNSLHIKDRALFILAQNDSPRSVQVLLSVAKGQSYPALQRSAIKYLGVSGSKSATAALVEIYNSSANPEIKRTILHSLLTSDAKTEVFNIARREGDPELRHEAIRQLGAMDARNEIDQLYSSMQTVADKRALLEAMGISDD